MTDSPLPTDPAAYNAPPDTQAMLAAMARRIVALERERKRIRREDWETLFRQIRTLAGELIAHPFLKGDLEAEARLDRMLLSADLEEFDRRVDDLDEYVRGKLAFNAAMAALERGDTAAAEAAAPPPPPPRARPDGGLSRMVAAQGPSGSDFDLGGPAGGDAPRRRGVIRL